eukprot:TRINITY_DN23190_c0_g1_i2.p1 TRINITY_DN23190_c0_g1~~TRINITY_DN23190_c0_g1_i2.p1  ORF type:complete len:788 (+),score=125.33 TRINITY_DN23190_c0_g1_i2:81-2366(+)
MPYGDRRDADPALRSLLRQLRVPSDWADKLCYERITDLAAVRDCSDAVLRRILPDSALRRELKESAWEDWERRHPAEAASPGRRKHGDWDAERGPGRNRADRGAGGRDDGGWDEGDWGGHGAARDWQEHSSRGGHRDWDGDWGGERERGRERRGHLDPDGDADPRWRYGWVSDSGPRDREHDRHGGDGDWRDAGWQEEPREERRSDRHGRPERERYDDRWHCEHQGAPPPRSAPPDPGASAPPPVRGGTGGCPAPPPPVGEIPSAQAAAAAAYAQAMARIPPASEVLRPPPPQLAGSQLAALELPPPKYTTGFPVPLGIPAHSGISRESLQADLWEQSAAGGPCLPPPLGSVAEDASAQPPGAGRGDSPTQTPSWAELDAWSDPAPRVSLQMPAKGVLKTAKQQKGEGKGGQGSEPAAGGRRVSFADPDDDGAPAAPPPPQDTQHPNAFLLERRRQQPPTHGRGQGVPPTAQQHQQQQPAGRGRGQRPQKGSGRAPGPAPAPRVPWGDVASLQGLTESEGESSSGDDGDGGWPKGMQCLSGFLSEEEEAELLAWAKDQQWAATERASGAQHGKRRAGKAALPQHTEQHYGWEASEAAAGKNPTQLTWLPHRPLPTLPVDLVHRMRTIEDHSTETPGAEPVPRDPDQLTGESVAPTALPLPPYTHRGMLFDGYASMVVLGAAATLECVPHERRRAKGGRVAQVSLPRRSYVCLAGAAARDYSFQVQGLSGGQRLVTLTFRKVRPHIADDARNAHQRTHGSQD